MAQKGGKMMLFVGPQTGAEYPARNKAYTLHTTASSGGFRRQQLKEEDEDNSSVLL